MKVTKKAKQAALKNQLGTNPKWALRALTVVYGYQTADEQGSGVTIAQNGVGFSGMDAEILSSFAEQVKRGRTLSPKQMGLLFKKMPRYWRQILDSIPESFNWEPLLG